MNKPSKCKNCQWYGKPYWSIINPCDNCPNENNYKTIITIDREPLFKEVLTEEEKKIPEKHINNCGDLIILGQQDNWLEPTIETDQKINAQLNPYVFEAINENFKDIENKIYEIIDYLKKQKDNKYE